MLTAAIIVFVCLALGGILKGATGAGAPILSIPALAMLFDVKFAVAVMIVPNLLTNLWQAWRYRHAVASRRFVWLFAVAGCVGVFLGTVGLARFSQEVLSMIVAAAVIAYVLFRLSRADWVLPFKAALRLSVPMGILAGALQGASGISAPASLTFLNAMRLERPVFIATISIFFTAMTALQIPSLAAFGILTPHRAMISVAALVPIFAFMPVGAMLARRVSRETFDRMILVLLAALAVKLAADAIW